MRWLFLIPLATGVFSGYIAQKSKDDIAYLTATIAVVSLFLGLVLAPWQIQLGILILALVIVGQVWQGRSSNHEEETPSAPAIAPEPEKVVLKYRGVPMDVTTTTRQPPPTKKPRKYRGVTIEPGA